MSTKVKSWTLEVYNKDYITVQEFADDLKTIANKIEQGYAGGIERDTHWDLKEELGEPST